MGKSAGKYRLIDPIISPQSAVYDFYQDLHKKAKGKKKLKKMPDFQEVLKRAIRGRATK